jgi:hypothetical protein
MTGGRQGYNQRSHNQQCESKFLHDFSPDVYEFGCSVFLSMMIATRFEELSKDLRISFE